MFLALLLALATGTSAPLRGDFDHDGRADIATFHPSPKGVVLSIRRGLKPDAPVLLPLRRGKVPDYLAVVDNPGRYKTACGKGYYGFESGNCTREEVTLVKGDLVFGFEESSEATVLWNGAKFQIEWLSD